MAAAQDVLKNINLHVDGRGYAGRVDEFMLPVLSAKTEEYRGGGMAAPLDLTMGLEKLTSEFVLISFDRDVLALFGVAEGFNTTFVMRGALESLDGTVTPAVATLRGKIVTLDAGTWKPGDKASLKITLALNYYRLDHGGSTVHEHDVANMVHIVGGVDQLAAQRAALGM